MMQSAATVIRPSGYDLGGGDAMVRMKNGLHAARENEKRLYRWMPGMVDCS